jgi:hypothetical protein
MSYHHHNWHLRTIRRRRGPGARAPGERGGGGGDEVEAPWCALAYPENLTVNNMLFFLAVPTLTYQVRSGCAQLGWRAAAAGPWPCALGRGLRIWLLHLRSRLRSRPHCSVPMRSSGVVETSALKIAWSLRSWLGPVHRASLQPPQPLQPQLAKHSPPTIPTTLPQVNYPLLPNRRPRMLLRWVLMLLALASLQLLM